MLIPRVGEDREPQKSWTAHHREGGVGMRYTKRIVQMLVTSALLSTTGAPASAEWYFDVYGGGGFIENNDVTLRKKFSIANELGSATLRLRATLRDVEASDFGTVGARFGYWLESVPYTGIGLDAFMVDLDTPRQTVKADANATLDVEVDDKTFHLDQGISLPVRIPRFTFPTTAVASAVDFMFRYPFLIDAESPKGRLQPYFNISPALFFTDAAPDVELGVKVGTGVAWQFHKYVALFVEYRFTHFSPEVERGSFRITQSGVSVKIRNPKVETDLNTHYILAGLSLRF
jgi:opacity protein-like surface antigen